MLTTVSELVAIAGWLGEPKPAGEGKMADAMRTAESLYENARSRGWRSRIRSMLSGEPGRLLRLGRPSGSAHDAGLQTVAISQIRGSENRWSDFDPQFHPLQSGTRDRWVSIASAHLLGAPVPTLELIQVGDIYYVRDGHHRLSVARALGQEYIEAYVTSWTK